MTQFFLWEKIFDDPFYETIWSHSVCVYNLINISLTRHKYEWSQFNDALHEDKKLNKHFYRRVLIFRWFWKNFSVSMLFLWMKIMCFFFSYQLKQSRFMYKISSTRIREYWEKNVMEIIWWPSVVFIESI